MNSEKIADMTVNELNDLVEQLVDRRIQTYFKPQDERSVEEIFKSIDEHRWTPPPGSKSSFELLREDRDA